MKHADHAFKSKNRTVHNWNTKFDAGIIQQISTWKIICSVNDDVVTRKNLNNIFGAQARVVSYDINIWIEHRQGFFGRVNFSVTDSINVVQDLSLQI